MKSVIEFIKGNYFHLLLALFLISSLIHSFIQHLYMPLDGDLASIVLPSEWYRKVLDNPFGFEVFLKNEFYAAPNRFFAHWTLSKYFKTMPGLLRSFLTPIESIYAACALAKILIQVAFIYLISSIISDSKSILNKNFILSAVLVTPLFQTAGYNGFMGVIDNSITYTFFYGLSIGMVLLFFTPFLKFYFNQQEIKPLTTIFLLPLCIITPFSGPIAPAVNVILCSVVLSSIFYNNFKHTNKFSGWSRLTNTINSIPSIIKIYFTLIIAISLYSFYIGLNNSENPATSIPIIERYQQMAYGIFFILTEKLGLPLLIIMIIVNVIIIRKFKNEPKGNKIITFSKWALLIICIYLLLLPLGGYREYRANIVRHDTILPITISLIFIYGVSTYYLLKCKHLPYKKAYIFSTVIFILIYVNSDLPINRENECEKLALEQIATIKQNPVVISANCSVMSWHIITNPDESKLNCELLKQWKVIQEEKLYYQK